MSRRYLAVRGVVRAVFYTTAAALFLGAGSIVGVALR